ncbi:DUF2490 domain-containing protein [Pontiellaceae bacterium B12219]|nr:DUF2490 domain-containing protein [Pontiellaceae bacterium B12219]
MNKKILLIGMAVILCAAGSKANDWQSVDEFFLTYNVTKEWSVFARSGLQFARNEIDLNLAFLGGGAAYKFHDHWKIGAAYRHLWASIDSQSGQENRPMIELTWFDAFEDIRLSNRSRFEFRLYDFDKENDFRYRNQTRAEFPWGIFGVKPYLEEEFFYSKNSEEINQNWLTGGIYFKPVDVMKIRVAYRWVALKTNPEWINVNQVYLACALTF